MFNLKQIKAFTFDTGGTVLDWHTGFKKGFDIIDFYEKSGIKSDEMANLFRKKSLEIITSQTHKKLVNFDTAHKMALEQILNEKKVQLDKEYIKSFSFSGVGILSFFKILYDSSMTPYFTVVPPTSKDKQFIYKLMIILNTD